MRALLQRVSQASVSVEGKTIGQIEKGLLVLLGIGPQDTQKEIDWLVKKMLGMRIFSDAEGKMNESVVDQAGGLFIVSQFTLYADTRKGNRPSFVGSAPPDVAEQQYEQFIASTQAAYPSGLVQTGQFGAHMQISLVNDGPVTIWLEAP